MIFPTHTPTIRRRRLPENGERHFKEILQRSQSSSVYVICQFVCRSVCVPSVSIVLILQKREDGKRGQKGSPWLIFILFPFDGLFLVACYLPFDVLSPSHLNLSPSASLSDSDKKQPPQIWDINNRKIISIFLSLQMSISEEAHTTCEYEMILLKKALRQPPYPERQKPSEKQRCGECGGNSLAFSLL